MKQSISWLVTIIMSVVFLTGCNSSEIKPIKEEKTDFDMAIATEMIKKKEELIIELSAKKTISLKEYKEYEQVFSKEFGREAQEIIRIFISLESEKNANGDFYYIEDTFYPTVFHEGITVTDAFIEKTYYENEFFNETYLTIKQEYTGYDPKLQDWVREYIFTENDDGNWEIYGFAGEMNFVGEDNNMNYLDRKE
ncbi:hypothetical protein [Alkalihalobacterium bogoriense]|uniref:hypothetical protein n=1 Tax=Alkalihalobacterium bogoriense TaxID=246272 RepID=UPI00047DE5B6|nr:hypothetical protein [Alkalihalobacterium bogoriense]